MSQAPSMPMFWDAYLADTTHLTTEEHGAYMLLLAAMWRRNGWVPDDDKDNARILSLTPAKWKRIKERLSVFLIFRDGQITQKNLLKIWEITQEKIEKNRENGSKGGRPKSNKNNNMEKANGYISQKPNETIPEPEPEPVVKREASASPKKSRGSRLLDDWALPRAYGEWALSEGWPEDVIREQASRFRDYWCGLSGQKAVKLDWLATWRNWMRNVPKQSAPSQQKRTQGDDRWNARMEAAAEFARVDSGSHWDAAGSLLSAERSDAGDESANDGLDSCSAGYAATGHFRVV